MQKKQQKITKSARKHVAILGINVLSTSMTSVLTAVKENISSSIKFTILTPNPELVLMAQGNNQLQKAINSADFAIPDGIGLSQAAKFLSFRSKNIFVTFAQGLFVGLMTLVNKDYLTNYLPVIKGRDFFLELIKLAIRNKWKVFLLGGSSNEAHLATEKLKIDNSLKTENCPPAGRAGKLEIDFHPGPRLDENGNPVSQVDIKMQSDVIKKINKIKPHFLFVAFGNPKQELWIYKNLSKLNIGGVMAVGGAFRYISGISKLPPKWMEEWGLEWVWRFITEPTRFNRIFNAFPLFPLKVFWYKLVGHVN